MTPLTRVDGRVTTGQGLVDERLNPIRLAPIVSVLYDEVCGATRIQDALMRGVVAAVRLRSHVLHTRIVSEPAQFRTRVIFAAVIDDDDSQVPIRLAGDTFDSFRYSSAIVVGRYRDRHQRLIMAHCDKVGPSSRPWASCFHNVRFRLKPC